MLVAAPQRPRFLAGTHTVAIHATVVDRHGQVVTNLEQADFEVYDNGQRQQLTLFDREIQPITIVVMLDRSGSMAGHFNLVRDAAETFVGNLLPADRAKIGSFSDRIAIAPAQFTSDRQELVRILREELQPPGVTPLWNATAAAMDALSNEEGRRVALVFTDGYDTPGLGQNTEFADIRRRAQIEETMVYGVGLSDECADEDRPAPRIGPGGVLQQLRPGRRVPGTPPTPGFPPRPPAPPAPGRPEPPWAPPSGPWVRPPAKGCVEQGPDPDLRELTTVGGGGYFDLRSTDDLAATFSRIAYELHHQYMLAFNATTLDGTMHSLEVRVRQRDVSVRARRSYLAGQ